MGRQSKLKRRAETPAPPSAVAAPAPENPRIALIVAAILAAMVLVVFAQLRTHQFLNYDDSIYVTENMTVQRGLTGDGIAWAFRSLDFNWHPVTWITHMLDVELFGLDAGKHLLVNVAFHLANTLLLFFLLRRLTGFTTRSAFVAALFAIHPLHVESVAWLSERKDVLSTLFLLLTIWMYADFARSRSKAKYALALLFFALGLMSKGMLVTLPFVLLLLDYWPLRRTDARTAVLEKIPFFVLTIGSIFVTFAAQRAVGAIATIHPFSTRLANAVVSYGAYLWKTVWPTGLAIPYPWRTSIAPWQVALSLIALGALSAAAFVFRRERPYLFTGWFWFAGMLVPVIGLIQIGSQSMADRYTYVPHIGLFIALVWLLAEALPAQARKFAGYAGVVVIALLAFVAHGQARHWHNSVSLFSHSTQVTRANSIAHLNLGVALQDVGDLTTAMQQLQAAVAADPRSADALVKLARLEMQTGNNESAAQHLQQAAAIDSNPETLALLGTAKGDATSALSQFAKAINADPTNPSLRNDYAAALARADRNDEALKQYQEAIRLNPNLYDPRMNIGALLSRLEKNADAREQFAEAARIRPNSPEPHVYLALINANSGRLDLAILSAESALKINPSEANRQFTNAVRMPFKETNLQEYVAYLQSQRR